MTAQELANEALKVYANKDNWTYCQGGLGEYANSSRIKGLYNYYRQKGNGSTCGYEEWLSTYGTNNGKAKQCTDCSNFIQYLIKSSINASVWHYTKMKDAGDWHNAPVGSLLLIGSGHVGIVVGPGKVMDFYKYNNTCRISDINIGLWDKAVYLDGIDYSTHKPTIAPYGDKFILTFDSIADAQSFIDSRN